VVADLAAAARNTEKIASRCAARGYTLRPLRRDRFPDELEILHRLSRAIFRDNFLYTDIPLPEFVRMYEGSGPLLRRDLVLFARSPAGEDIGFVFALPDEIDAVRAMRGGRGAAARLRFLLRRGRAGAVNVKTLGVLPRHRGSGVAVQLVHAIYRAALDSGFGRANLCLIRDGNASARLDGGASDLLRRYALYEYRGAPPP
jgi:GNAT superfamily N-acetyltransferase